MLYNTYKDKIMENKTKPKLIRTREVMELTTLKRSTISKLIKDGNIVPPIKLLGRINAWYEEDILNWIKSQQV
ncbi:MAG: AlpA family phage regulatory protein [Neisseriaceae bacterium]|nr:MAG: AlpA family phage regulatory protein [Neisseriaceae bacterium]